MTAPLRAAIAAPRATSSEPAAARRRLLGYLALGMLTTSAPLLARATPRSRPARPVADVWKDPNCGCCKEWINHLTTHGYPTRVHEEGNAAARQRLGMPQRLGSCHTARIDGYVIEGHVPATDIDRLLRERPVALGLAVPGMPIGSPGMDGPEYGARRDRYQVLLVQRDGATRVWRQVG